MKQSYVICGFCSVLLISSALCDVTNNNIEDSAENAVEISTQRSTFSSSSSTTKFVTQKTVEKTTIKSLPSLVCPGKEISRPFFSLPCKITTDCGFLGKNILCCNSRCLNGIVPPKAEPIHEPTLFGLVERACPKDPIPEIFEVKVCTSDADCAPRICCPEKLTNGEQVGYCRTAEPNWDKVPVVRPFLEPFKTIVSYMQCTPPPPPILDIFPKTCNTPLDCFPNLCCQEKGKKYCRPPKRSLLALVADIGQRLIPTETARKFIERIS